MKIISKAKNLVRVSVIAILLVLALPNVISYAAVSESESNNTLQDADVIAGSYTDQDVLASIGTVGDVDCFSFTPNNSGGYAVVVTSTSKLYGSLHESDERLIDWNKIDTDVGSNELQIIGQFKANNTYYIQIYNTENSTAQYSFRIIPRILDTMEMEPNNSINEAFTLLNANYIYPTTASILKAGDVDYYRFSPGTGGLYTFESTGSTDVRAYLYDKNMNSLAYNDNTSGVNFRLAYNLTAFQTYYIKVLHSSGTGTGNYSIKITPPSIMGPDAEGSSFSTASTISIDTYGINSASDQDYFKFTAAENGYYMVESMGLTDTYADVYSGNQVFICSDDNSGEGDNFRAELQCEANKTYYVKVRGVNGKTGPYTLKVKKGRILKVPNYSQQPYHNICWASTAAMTVSSILKDSVDRSVDIAKEQARLTYTGPVYQGYRYPNVFNQPQMVDVMGYCVNSYVNDLIWENKRCYYKSGFDSKIVKDSIDGSYPVPTIIQWVRAGGGGHFQVITGYVEENGVFYVIYNDPWDGKEYISDIRNYSNNDKFYWTDCTIFKKSIPIDYYKVEHEPNNSTAEASLIPVVANNGLVVSASIGSSTDVDYFKFSPGATANYTIQTTGTTATTGSLYDSNGNLISTVDISTDNNFKFAAQLIWNKAYYIKVAHKTGGTGNYNINITIG